MNSYYDVPDAPWIRDAEINGMPEGDTVYCPVCGAEDPEDFYTDVTGVDVIGCDCCMKRHDAHEWYYDRKRRGVA